MRLSVPNTATLLIIAAAVLLLLLVAQTYSSLAASRNQLGESRERVEQLSVELGAATERHAAERAKVESLTTELSTDQHKSGERDFGERFTAGRAQGDC